MLKNIDTQKHIRELITKVDAVNPASSWKYLGNLVWKKQDRFGNYLGIVNVKICVKTGICVFKYDHDNTTYLNVKSVPSKTVNYDDLKSDDAYNLILDFDSEIINAHNLEVVQ